MSNRFLFSKIVVIAFCLLGAKGQEKPIDLLDVVSHAKDYDGKRITVRATFRYGFEWNELYCLPSTDIARVKLKFPPELSKAAQAAIKRLPKHGGTVNGIFTGTFRGTGGPFGDGGYQYQLEFEEIANVQVISKTGPNPDRLQPQERAKVCSSNSKSP